MTKGIYKSVYRMPDFMERYPTIGTDSKVLKVVPHSDFTLSVWFKKDNQERIFDFKPLLKDEVFYADLNDLDLFMKAKVSFNGVYWNDKLDIAPEWLYLNSDPVAVNS